MKIKEVIVLSSLIGTTFTPHQPVPPQAANVNIGLLETSSGSDIRLRSDIRPRSGVKLRTYVPETTQVNPTLTQVTIAPFQPAQPKSPPPVPAFYPEIISSPLPPLATENELLTLDLSETKDHGDLLIKINHLEQENLDINLTLDNLLLKFDHILEVITESVIQSKQETPIAAPLEEAGQRQTISEVAFEEIERLNQIVSNLEQENLSLSQALRLMLIKQEENDSSIDKIELQICQLQEQKEDVKDKRSLFNTWFTED